MWKSIPIPYFDPFGFPYFSPVSSSAQTVEADSEKKLLSRFLLLKTDNAFTEKAIRSDAQRLFDLLVIAYPELPSEAFQIVIEETRLSNSKFLDRKIAIYDKYFSLEELRKIMDFHESRVGRKTNQKILKYGPQAQFTKEDFTREEAQAVHDFFTSPLGLKLADVDLQTKQEIMKEWEFASAEEPISSLFIPAYRKELIRKKP